MRNTRLTIGEFSHLMQVTVKTLRYYEQKGLLKPDEVDDWTGYRYYGVHQMQRLQTIRDFQRLGFTLDEIGELYQDSTHVPGIDQLSEKIRQTDEQLRMLKERRCQLLEWLNARKTINTMEKFEICSLPEIIVASHREVLPNYEAVGPMCVQVIGPEMQRLGCECPSPGYCFTIDHNKEYKPMEVDVEYCEQVREMGQDSAIIQFKRLSAVPKAVCMKHYGPYNRFYESFCELVQYIEDHGYKMIDSPRFCYVDGIWNEEDEEKWLSIIQAPVDYAD